MPFLIRLFGVLHVFHPIWVLENAECNMFYSYFKIIILHIFICKKNKLVDKSVNGLRDELHNMDRQSSKLEKSKNAF
jgi:hypothetical protein